MDGLFFADLWVDEFVEQVLHGDEAGEVACFIQDESHVATFGLELLQQGSTGLSRGYEVGWLEQGLELTGTEFLPGGCELEKIFREENSTDLAEVISVDGETGKTFVSDELKNMFDTGAQRDADDISSPGHYASDRSVGEVEDAMDQLCFIAVEDTLFFAEID